MRPVRFAFLVRPDDKKRALEIFRVNTCLWGGTYNPIIPFFKQVPRWWDRHNHRFDTAIQIINGYLDFFLPDFLVEAEPGLAEGLGFEKERALPISSLLTRSGGWDKNGHGLNVFSLYNDLYHKEFQFARRHEHDIVDAVPEKRAFGEFSAAFLVHFLRSPIWFI